MHDRRAVARNARQAGRPDPSSHRPVREPRTHARTPWPLPQPHKRMRSLPGQRRPECLSFLPSFQVRSAASQGSLAAPISRQPTARHLPAHYKGPLRLCPHPPREERRKQQHADSPAVLSCIWWARTGWRYRLSSSWLPHSRLVSRGGASTWARPGWLAGFPLFRWQTLVGLMRLAELSQAKRGPAPHSEHIPPPPRRSARLPPFCLLLCVSQLDEKS